MITTRRNTNSNTQFASKSNVALLERNEPKAYNEVSTKESFTTEDVSQKERTSNNLEKLLNYEKYLGRTESVIEDLVEEVKTPEVKTAPKATSNEDIMPSSTTMQFGDGDPNILFNDLKKDKAVASKHQSKFEMSANGKILVSVYAIVIATILALIVINTSLIASLRNTATARTAKLNGLSEQHQELMEELNNISSDQYVIETATGEYNMVN